MTNIVKLFCFPYAAGSATAFYKWKPLLKPGIELIPVEYPGRGHRIREQWYEDRAEAVSDLKQKVLSNLNGCDFAFFGHSLGALFAYYIAQELRQVDGVSPQHIFFSSKSSPDVEQDRTNKFHLMPEDQFRQEVLKLGGTPPEIFNDAELTNFFMPLLRNDFKISENNAWQGELNPFECDISVLIGKDDDYLPPQVTGWKNHTNGFCTISYFNGGHFYLHDELPSVLKLINRNL